ncbi:MAG: hypothetical protein C5B50_14100 [Verrucomicrobia bacterium]|nr:MAG: hypothetical protein C5B50_14100 [Verrucomicrobiota bacterium]
MQQAGTQESPQSVSRSTFSGVPPPTVLLLLAICAVIGLWLRCQHLGLRPMHNDEAVNAIKFRELWENGSWKYDPQEYHGPSLAYSTLVLSWITRAPAFEQFTERRLRAVALVYGLGLILLLPLVADGLGRRGMVWAGLLTAVSPAMVFYSDYYIHEMLLVFFTFLALGAAWRYWRTRKIGWALTAGLGLGLMDATKETFLLSLCAAGIALVLNQAWNRFLDASALPVKPPRLSLWHLAAAAGVWAVIWLLFYSSFCTNWAGLADSFKTYLPWFRRAGGASPHLHSWKFYLHRLLLFHPAPGPIWSEALIFALAIFGAASGFIRKMLGRASASFVRFLAIYSFALMAGYSLLAYKTPWCALSFWHGMILQAGVGAAVLHRKAALATLLPPVILGIAAKRVVRFAVPILLLAGAANLGWQAALATGTFAADQRNPYVYAQTTPEVEKAADEIEALANASPKGHDLAIKVIGCDGDYWPLPWYLRRFKNVGYWDSMPSEPYADVMLVCSKLQAALDEKKTHLMRHEFALRPSAMMEFYVELEVWKSFLSKNPPKPDAD